MRIPPRARLARYVPLYVTGVILFWLFNRVLPVGAQDFTWLPNSGVSDPSNWFDPLNWGGPDQTKPPLPPVIPGPGNSVSVNTETTSAATFAPATITGGAATINQLLIGAIITKAGIEQSGTGEVIVNGPGASLTVSGTKLPTGQASLEVVSGELLVENGATLTTFGSFVGRVKGSSASVNVFGSGSTWIENGALNIGIGQVTISGGASLRAAGTVTIGLGGTLEVGTGGVGGTVNAPSIINNGTISFDLSDSTTLSAPISGPGVLFKSGSGTVTLTGIDTYTGTTTVNNGSLIVDGSIGSAQTVVDPGGSLGGIGFLSGNLLNNGTVSPGNPVGTLKVGGNYTQTAGGTLRISVGGLDFGQFSLLAVDGHATLGGNLQLISLNNFKLQVGNTIKFLTAHKGISGTFSAIENPFISDTIVQAQVVLIPDAVEIEGTQGSFASLPGLTPNELAVAKALDSAAGDPRAAALFAFLNSQPLANLPHDLNLIAPAQISSMNATTVSLGKVQASNIGSRLLNIRAGSTGFSSSGFGITGGAASFDGGLAGPNGAEGKAGPPVFAPTPENRWGVFVTGTGEFTNVDSTPNAAGYNVNTGGITAGIDYRLTPNLVIGLDGSYAHTNVNLDGGGNVEVNAGTVGLYATAFANGFYLDAAAGGGPNGYDTNRTALQGSASGSTNGANVNVLVAGGYDWKRGNFSIGPTATFQFSYVSINEFTETGSLAPLKIQDQNYESERTIFGARASYIWKIGNITLIPQVSAGWVHEYGSVAYSVVANFANGAGNSFTVNGPEIGRDGVLVTAGMSMLWTDRISTYVYYDGELARTNYDSHTVVGGIRVSF